MSDDYGDDYEVAAGDEVRYRPGPVLYALVGFLLGAVALFVLLGVTVGNPLSTANRVDYLVLVPVAVDTDTGQVCWSEEPDRRDAPLTCAVLTVDAAQGPPVEGEAILAGIVDLETPDGTDQRQLVYVAPPPPDAEVDLPAPDEDDTGSPEDADAGNATDPDDDA